MPTLNLNKAEFLKSAVSPSGFLTADLPCIVFAGKSNVGKSSVINRLLNRRNFARVGSQPGKTVHVNYFCKKSEIEPNLARIRETLLLPDDAVLLPFSAEKGTGREALLGEILRAVG